VLFAKVISVLHFHRLRNDLLSVEWDVSVWTLLESYDASDGICMQRFGLNVNMQYVVVVMLLMRTVLMLAAEGHQAPRWTLVS